MSPVRDSTAAQARLGVTKVHYDAADPASEEIARYHWCVDRHRLAERTSIELHRMVAHHLRTDDRVLARAKARVARWLEGGMVHRHYAERWAQLLDGSIDELCAKLVADDEEARALRQVSPFAGVIDPRTRWTIWRRIRAQAASQ